MKKMTKVLALVLALAMCLALCACGKGESKDTAGDKKTFIMGVDPEYPPFSYLGDDGKFTGFDVEICQAVIEAIRATPEKKIILNLPTTVDALPYYVAPKNIALFERQKVFTREEVESRYEIKMETYIKVIDIEALSTIDISRHLILPAAIAYAKDVAATINMKKSVAPELEAEAEKALLSNLTAQTNALYKATDRLEAVLKAGDEGADMLERARYTRDKVITAMDEDDVVTFQDLEAAKATHQAGDTVTLTVFRNGEKLELSLTLDEQPRETVTDTSSQQQQQPQQNNQYYGWPFGGFFS